LKSTKSNYLCVAETNTAIGVQTALTLLGAVFLCLEKKLSEKFGYSENICNFVSTNGARPTNKDIACLDEIGGRAR